MTPHHLLGIRLMFHCHAVLLSGRVDSIHLMVPPLVKQKKCTFSARAYLFGSGVYVLFNCKVVVYDCSLQNVVPF